MSIEISGSQKGEDTDDYLIELIGLKEDFPDEALEAYGEIYRRYWKPTYRMALDFTKSHDDAEDLVADTFCRIYSRASSFKKGKLERRENVRLAVLGWIKTVMKTVFFDLYLDDENKFKKDDNPLEESYIIEKVIVFKHIENEQEDLLEELEQLERDPIELEAIEKESSNLKKVTDYLNKQNEREKDIIRSTYNFYQPGKNTPKEVLDYLEKTWGTSRQNIRKILEKFRKAIKADLQTQLTIRN